MPSHVCRVSALHERSALDYNKRVHSFECACVLSAQVVPVHGSPFINKAVTPRVGLDTNGDFAISAHGSVR